MPTAFEPDGATAGCDSSGQIVKYFHSTAYPGSSDAASPLYGKAVSYYLNGLNDLTGDNYYDMLDGMLIRTETWDNAGTLKESTAVTYQVFEQVALDPGDPTVVVQLRGGWVAQTEQVSYQDGVTSTQTSTYVESGFSAPFTSQPASQASASYGGNGKSETFTQATSYAATIYAGLQAINALDEPAQQTSTRTGDDGTVPVQVMATTYSSWASALGEGVMATASEASFGLLDASSDDFPYSTYEAGNVPDGWVLAARTTERTTYGQEQESVDSLGVPTATFYGLDSAFAVAKVPNAAFDGTAFLGFQSYEDTSAWMLTGVTYDDDDARTGTRSAVLPGGVSAAAAVTVTPRNADCSYLVGCWYKTPAGFAAGSSSGWTATVTADGVQQSPVFVAFEDTGDEWAYRTFPVPLPDADSLSVALSVANGTSQDVHLNSLFVGPLVNGLTARTFDTATQLPMSTMDASGRTSRIYFDRAGRPTVMVGASGQVRELAQRFLSRKGSPDGQFQASSPNAELTLHPAAGGVLETFRDGEAWRTRWTASGDWEEGDGVLAHTGTASGTLTWTGQPSADTWAVYFELQSTGKPDVSIAAGDVTVRYSGGSYSADQSGTSWTQLVQPPDEARHWLLVIGEGVVLFFGDGQLLFSQKTSLDGSGLVITAGGDDATFRHLAVVEDIRLGLSYNDAAGRQRQVQQLHGADSLVTEVVFDPLGRQVATTRNAPGSFGTGADLAVLQYSPGFLDVNTFLANLSSTWKMTGDVADYYRGQQDGPVKRSDDQGYPYRGTRYEDSPRSMQLEQSQPGKAYAIDLTVPASERQTVQYAYGTNTGTTPDLPAGDYFQNTLTSPVKTGSVQLTDKLGQQVATLYNDAEGALVSQAAGSRTYTDGTYGPEATLVTQLPNATTSGPQSGSSSYLEVSTVDGLQRTTELSDPDSGNTQFISDSTGRLRFVQPALDTGEAWFIYYKYDPLGRMTEEGTVAATWDREALMKLAEDQDWPSQDNTVSVTTSWDGDGDDSRRIGKKVQSVSYNPAPASDPDAGDCMVTETFGYDDAGRIISVRMQTSGAVEADGIVGYSYNVLGNVTQADMPEGASPASIFYTYNDQGQIVAVGTTAGGAELAACTWDADGNVQTQVLDGWEQLIDYASPGWPLSMTTSSADGTQSLGFTYTWQADGAVDTREVAFSFTGVSDTDSETFTYDGQRRLLSATGTRDVLFTSYDPSGNIWSVEQEGVEQSFPLQSGSDRLESVTIGGETSSVAYNARGQMTEGMDRTLTYDKCTAMTTTISTSTGSGSASLRLAYGGTQQRVFKQVREGDGQDVVYFCGAGQFPVARFQGGAWSVLVQGPLGLLAVQSDQLLYPLTDITKSTWAVVGSGGLLARYVYLPFGQQAVAQDSSGIAFPYLYQGQEWDSEVELYNFRSRMYDPVLRRFLSPDPARQFASLYVFAADNPLTSTDPTGDISVWAQVGIGAAMVAITAVGIGLTLFTGGASDAAAASADAALLGVEAGAEVAAEAGGEAAAAGAAEGAAEAGVGSAAAGAEGAAASGASEVAAGASTAEAAASASTSTSLSTMAVNVLGSTLSGAGTSGLQYDIQHGRDFTAQGFFEAMGIGAASGFVSGVASAGLTSATSGLATSVLGKIATKAAIGGVSGLLSSDVSTVLTNVAQHQSWDQGLAKSSITGFAQGAAIGAASGAWSEKTNLAKMAGVSDQNVQQVSTMVERVQAAATTNDAKMIYITAAYFVVAGYAVWGAAELSQGS
ncbi:MAG: RHS repeat-associated core domain-containing protein [Thermoanaerobaculia bacterium]